MTPNEKMKTKGQLIEEAMEVWKEFDIYAAFEHIIAHKNREAEQRDKEIREEERSKLYEPTKVLLAKYQSFGLTDYEKKQLDYLLALNAITNNQNGTH